MIKIKGHPVRILSVLSLFMIIAFLAVAASGFRGIMPGSMIYSNKLDNGYYVFHRLLKELGYSIEFENNYIIPQNSVTFLLSIALNFSGRANRFPMIRIERMNRITI